MRRTPARAPAAILAQPADELVANRVLDLLTTPSFRDAVVRGSGGRDDGAVARVLAELGSAESRLQTLDDDYYVRGVLAPHRYRSIRVRLEREVERLHALATEPAGSASFCTLTPAGSGPRPTLASDGSSYASSWSAWTYAGPEGGRCDPSRLRISLPVGVPGSAKPTSQFRRRAGLGQAGPQQFSGSTSGSPPSFAL